MARAWTPKQRVRVKGEDGKPDQFGAIAIGTTKGHGDLVVVRLDEEYHLTSEDEGLRILADDQLEPL